ncbi:1638_t:CDS:2 [Cetraspora pellucida]|uniref:1638_t:CDS:1 n=1 Tax=Cetraspora pellucida TaxID=1433469 RepID=A0A9N9DK38_9GLOM|nr:1638_t:CDS:2 [Cetraspora pellucida]
MLLRKKKNIKGREDTIGLGETEEIPPQDADMDNRNEIEDLDDNVQEIISEFIKKKKKENKDDKVPKTIIKGISKYVLGISSFLTEEENHHKKEVLGIRDKDIPLIVNSESLESVVASHLLQELGIRIERPSVVNMINIHEESKRVIGEISNFPFSVSRIEIPINIIITDATFYCAIVSNDWLAKVNAAINWNSSDMTIYWDDKEITVPVKFRKMTRASLEKERMVAQKEEDQCIADLFDYCYENET